MICLYAPAHAQPELDVCVCVFAVNDAHVHAQHILKFMFKVMHNYFT